MVVGEEQAYRERRSAAYTIIASPNEENTIEIYKVSPAKKFKLERVQIAFPVGSAFELQIAVYRGLEKVKPTTGVYSGDGFVIADITGVEFYSGDSVKLWYKNLSSTDIKRAIVILEGYEE